MRAHRSLVLSRAVRSGSSIILSAAVIFAAFAGIAANAARAAAPPVFAVQTFGTGTLIIPMDAGANGQDNGMLRAYGLVYELLRRGVPVNWVIDPAKPANGTDFAINAPNMITDVRTGSVLAPRNYAGGPFVIDAADAAAAMPIIFAWQAAAGDQTAVHMLSFGSFNGDVSRRLIAAPRIAILKDGNETIAFNNLNAAGIPDSTGSAWSASSPDLLTEAAVAGPSSIAGNDGALFHQPSGSPRYAYLNAMHYLATAQTSAVVAEMRSWLDHGSLTHAFMQCEAARVVENNGFFLTTAGIIDDGAAPATVANRFPSSPLAQIEGAFVVDSGAVDSFKNNGGSYKTGVTTIFNNSSSVLTESVVELSGRMDGDNLNGRVTYLAGHDYSTSLPMSSNPQTNGVRLFLNSIFETDGATDPVQPDVVVTKSAPAYSNSGQITYTINYSNPGPRPVENIKLVDRVPVGAAVLSMTPAATSVVGSTITWNLPPLGPGASGSVSFTVFATDGSYANRATLDFAHMAVKTVTSNTVTTIVDTVAPNVQILASPVNPIYTNDQTPTFLFSVNDPTATSQCRIGSGPFVPCSTPSFTTPTLTDGTYILEVMATDAAGNIGNSVFGFVVDTIAPTVTITAGPTGTTSDTTPTFAFTTGGSPVTTVCLIDSGAPVSCSGSFTSPPLSGGTHTFSVTATDAAGNSTTATRTFTVNTVSLVSIQVTPVNTSMLVGGTQQFSAFGIYSDGTAQDLTNSVTWSSTNIAVARVSNAVGTQGLATGLAVGTVQITARLGTIQGSTTLTVTTLKAMKQAVLAELRAALAAATSNKDKNNLKDAIKKLEKSLENDLWKADGNHLDCNRGNKVFGREKQAVKQLMQMLADTGVSSVSDATILRWITTLVAIDRRLAEIAVTEANVSPQTRAAALEQIARGDNDVADCDYDKAITHYKRAWKKVRSCNGGDDDEDDDDNCGRHDH